MACTSRPQPLTSKERRVRRQRGSLHLHGEKTASDSFVVAHGIIGYYLGLLAAWSCDGVILHYLQLRVQQLPHNINTMTSTVGLEGDDGKNRQRIGWSWSTRLSRLLLWSKCCETKCPVVQLSVLCWPFPTSSFQTLALSAYEIFPRSLFLPDPPTDNSQAGH